MSDIALWRVAWGKAPVPKPGERGLWLPLHVHLTDSGEVARRIWADWLGTGVRAAIARDTGGDEQVAGKIVELAASLHDIGKLSVAFAGQVREMRTEMERRGFRWPKESVEADSRQLPHTLAGYAVLLDCLLARGVPRQNAEAFVTIVGSHHGVPPNDSEISAASIASAHLGHGEWDTARVGLIDYVIETQRLEPAIEALMTVRLSDASQLLITAVVVMADWIASSANYFDLAPRFEQADESSALRADRAWRTLDLPLPWEPDDEALTADATDLLRSRFGVPFEANEVQRLALDSARAMSEPGLLLLEAVMGAGKTEASLLAAEVLARKFGRSGVFYGLPTRATADAMFHRLLCWWQSVPDAGRAHTQRGVMLRHSTAPLNDEYRALPRRGEGLPGRRAERAPLEGAKVTDVGRDVAGGATSRRRGYSAELIAHHWTSGRKQASFAETVVATIDHQLLVALTSRHVMLRHLGLSRQVVILDEVHSADTWMEVYLERALEWLARYGVPVIALSATLPPARRQALISAYERGRRAAVRPAPREVKEGRSSGLVSTRPARALPIPAVPDSDRYPLVTTLSNGVVRQVSAQLPAGSAVHLEWLQDDDGALVAVLDPLISAGGCALVVCNTVRGAVRLYRHLRTLWGESVSLSHSRFIAHDRSAGDTWLRETFGPGEDADRRGRVVIATQVAEQSLDIDFDLLVTDLAPVDLILQRIGRLHRHHRMNRPVPGRVPRCLITGMSRLPSDQEPPLLDKGGVAIYSAHLLLRTAAILNRYVQAARPLQLPDDVPALVRECYGEQPVGPSAWQEQMDSAARDFVLDATRTAHDAKTYCLPAPGTSRLVIGLLQANVGEAETSVGVTKQVRQADGGFEVILLRQAPDGLSLLPSLGDERAIPTDRPPHSEMVRLLARSMVRVPGWVTTNPRDTDDVLDDLASRYYPAWQKDSVLAGQLLLVLDSDGMGRMGPFSVRYDSEIGLEVWRG